jgi:hypothetical protein
MTKKTVQTVCRVCSNDSREQADAYCCPRREEEDQRYKLHLDELKKSLSFYLLRLICKVETPIGTAGWGFAGF